jgi:general secretion pathway protein D
MIFIARFVIVFGSPYTEEWIRTNRRVQMRALLILLSAIYVGAASAGDKMIDFTYKNEDLTKVLADYSHASGQKFIIDPSVRGKITILNPGSVSIEEAFNQLSSALAVNGLGLSTQDNVMVVMQARALQRNLIGVGQTLPPPKPERMFTWVVTLKYVSADDVNRQLRILTSKDGELVPYLHTNQLVISDWVSNLYRIQNILKELDVPAGKEIKSTMAPRPPKVPSENQ